MRAAVREPVTGIRANLPQFLLLVGVNALVGGMVGQERTILPLLAQRVFGIDGFTVLLTFLLAFGVTKAVTNLVAGAWADRVGRKPVLIAGWIVGLPVPVLLMVAPTWGWIVVANVLLGVNQGLSWSMTVTMKIDLAGEQRRGLAMGLNEAAGYGAVAATAALTGFIAARAGVQPEPFYLGLMLVGLGLGLSTVFVKETLPFARSSGDHISMREVFAQTSFRDRTMSACSQAGLVNNLNDGMAWGLLPIWFARGGLSIASVGALLALYPAVWGVGQVLTGALSDRVGRKKLIVTGMFLQALAIGMIAYADTFAWWVVASVSLGAGTAMVYPTLLAAVADVASPQRRASSVGVYRFWRDAGFAVGAVVAGAVADLFGLATAIWMVAGLTLISGLVVWVRMREPLDGPLGGFSTASSPLPS